MTNGNQANRTGNELEQFIKRALEDLEYTESQNGSDLFKYRKTVEGQFYAKQVIVGKTVFGHKRRVDFFLVNKSIFPDGLIIECKWQQVSGSVDEKYSHLRDNILETGIPTIVVAGGNGYKPEALDWLKRQIDKRILLAVWNMEEFQIAKNTSFFGTGIVKPIRTPRRTTKQIQQQELWRAI